MESAPALPSSSSSPPRQEQPTIDSTAPRACLTVLQGALTLASMPAEGVCQIMKGMVATQGQGTAAAMQALRTLRDALDEVLEDGESGRGDALPAHRVFREESIAGPDTTSTTTLTNSTAIHRFTACARVLHNTNLLTSIIGWLFHEHHMGPSRVALGQTALVCKDWRYISRQTCFWQPLLRQLRPAIGANDESLVQGRGHESHFAFLFNYGKCLVEKGVVTGDVDLFDGLELQVEMWNAGNDDVPSHRIYSAVGPIRASINAGAAPYVTLRLSGPSRKEVAGPAFSAADLDPVYRRYATMAECFDTSQEVGNPVHLCMRVSVLDRQTGKMALVWSSGKETKYAFLQSTIDTYSVQPPVWVALHRRRRMGVSSSSSPADAGLDDIG